VVSHTCTGMDKTDDEVDNRASRQCKSTVHMHYSDGQMCNFAVYGMCTVYCGGMSVSRAAL
jgi:hypothetical protein